MPDKPVLVETYKLRSAVEDRLNQLAKDLENRYELKFYSTAVYQYSIYHTIVLIWTL